MKFKRQGKARPLRLTCERNSNDSPRTFIENILAQNQNRTKSCLFTAPYWIQVSPADFTS